MEYRTISGRRNAWSQNTSCTGPAVGRTFYPRNQNMEQDSLNSLSNIDSQQPRQMQMVNINRNITTENSMSAYSEKMRRISLERTFATPKTNQRREHRRWSSLHPDKPDELSSAELKDSLAVANHSDVTRSESYLMRQSNVGRHFRGCNISDSALSESERKNYIGENRLSRVKNGRFDIIIKEGMEDEGPAKSDGSVVNSLHKLEEVRDSASNGCQGTLSESIVEITPFPPYKESTFYKQRMRSSRLRFAQSEYIDRTEHIASKIRPTFAASSSRLNFGPVRFAAKVPLWKQKALEARKERWKRRTIPPKPPPKTYHHVFRYSDAVKELFSSHDSSSDVGNERGANRHTNPILTFSDVDDGDSLPVSPDRQTRVSWNSEGLVTKDRHLRDSSDTKTVQFKLPKVEDTTSGVYGLASSFHKHKAEDTTSGGHDLVSS
ncbi:uncharacterized protein LOC121378866 [Gigantopelta aegis]|uniref:uncharacterized protein LOC121378866 n=1 Tax=Gigantopelta aegis TaxID=1735272 RepID=UPI001B88DEBE|nr:uncharacterized protein LOC121378866 [Gigantopelta aegis]